MRADPVVKRRWAVIVLCLSLALSAFLSLRSPTLPEDDAFITFRYVRNYLDGRGLVYNDSERVLGVSSPFHLVFLCAVGSLFRATPVDVLAVRFNLVPFLATGITLFLLMQRITRRPVASAILAAVFLLDAHVISQVGDGMESFWFTLWLSLALLASLDRRTILAGIATGLAILTRPEGIVLLPAVALTARSSRKQLLRFFGIVVVAIIPWVIFASWYYGSPIPHSIIAKARPVYPISFGFAVIQMAKELGIVWLLMVLAGGIASVVAVKEARPVLCFVACLCALYALGNPLMFSWYYPPIRAGGIVLFAAVPACMARTDESQPRRSINSAWRVVFVLACLIHVVAPHVTIPLRDRIASPTRRRILAYREAAVRLNPLLKTGDITAAPEIGTLGFYLNGPLLDGCGLVSPQALPFLPVPMNLRLAPDVGAMPFELVQSVQPKWLVAIPCFVRHGVLSQVWFSEHYEIAFGVRLPQKLWDEQFVVVFRRRD